MANSVAYLGVKKRRYTQNTAMHLVTLFAFAILLIPSFQLSSEPRRRRRRQAPKVQVEIPKRHFKIFEDAKGFQEPLDALLNALPMQKAEVSVYAYNETQGKALFEFSSDASLCPASNAKLWTTLASMELLGLDFRWRTNFYTRGTLRDGVLSGPLVIKGSGDPTIVNEVLERMAEEIASNLRANGISSIPHGLTLDLSVFDNIAEAKGWELENQKDRAYAAGVSALSLNYNAIGVHIQPDRDAKVSRTTLVPSVGYGIVDGEAASGRRARRLKVNTELTGANTTIHVSGRAGYLYGGKRIYRRAFTPANYFAKALRRSLRANGIQVGAQVRTTKVQDKDSLLYTYQSPALHHALTTLNHYSNNLVAETLVKTIAAHVHPGKPAGFNDGLEAIRNFLRTKVGILNPKLKVMNGSGLNRVNTISSRDLVKLIRYGISRPEYRSIFLSALSVGGERGTIRSRYRGKPASGSVRAKTGTLTGVSALSGVVENSGGDEIVFAVLTQGYRKPIGPKDMWAFQDSIVSLIYDVDAVNASKMQSTPSGDVDTTTASVRDDAALKSTLEGDAEKTNPAVVESKPLAASKNAEKSHANLESNKPVDELSDSK